MTFRPGDDLDPVQMPEGLELGPEITDIKGNLYDAIRRMIILELRFRAYDSALDQGGWVKVYKETTERMLKNLAERIFEIVVELYRDWKDEHPGGAHPAKKRVDVMAEHLGIDKRSNQIVRRVNQDLPLGDMTALIHKALIMAHKNPRGVMADHLGMKRKQYDELSNLGDGIGSLQELLSPKYRRTHDGR